MLRWYREAAGLSQDQLAERAGLSAKAIGALERGERRRPHPQTIDLLAKALGLEGEERRLLVGATRATTASSLVNLLPGPPAPKHNLPFPLTSFVGRERELAEVTRLLGTTRLLTFTGTGGGGKTRLALEAAAALVDAYPDGVWLVELVSLTDSTLIPDTVASALGVRVGPGQSIEAALLSFVRTRLLLVLLDNCEHLIEGCARLADELLGGSPSLRILATSREPLRVQGEVVWRIPSLATPDPDLPTDSTRALATVERSDAVRLFVERARLIAPTFAVTASNCRALARICHRLDGIPLAIELAAARAGMLSPDQISSRLDNSFHLLTRGSRTTLPRHRTLRAMIDWSYDLLSDSEKALARRLSVFAGAFALEAAEAVCAFSGVERWEVLDLLTELVDKSLVLSVADGSVVRYRLLETLRQYLGERLLDAGETSMVRDHHRDWYHRTFDALRRAYDGGAITQGDLFQAIERERDNLRLALDWSRETATGLGLGGVLEMLWTVHGLTAHGRAWLRASLERAPEPTAERSGALFLASLLSLDAGDYAAASALAEECLAVAREVGDSRRESAALNNLGRIADATGQTALARRWFEESLGALRNPDSEPHGLACTYCYYALTLWRQGERDAAKRFLGEGLNLSRRVNQSNLQGWILFHLAGLTLDGGDVPRTRELLNTSLAAFRTIHDRPGIGSALGDLGYLAALEGDSVRAGSLLREGLTLLLEVGHRPRVARATGQLAVIAMRHGDAERSGRLVGIATTIHEHFQSFLDPVLAAHLDASADSAKVALGSAGYNQAIAEGQAMSLEQAMAYALKQVEG
jgi:predicted ATPase/DNA-binding XRE family transcriptional regulator